MSTAIGMLGLVLRQFGRFVAQGYEKAVDILTDITLIILIQRREPKTPRQFLVGFVVIILWSCILPFVPAAIIILVLGNWFLFWVYWFFILVWIIVNWNSDKIKELLNPHRNAGH